MNTEWSVGIVGRTCYQLNEDDEPQPEQPYFNQNNDYEEPATYEMNTKKKSRRSSKNPNQEESKSRRSSHSGRKKDAEMPGVPTMGFSTQMAPPQANKYSAPQQQQYSPPDANKYQMPQGNKYAY